MSFHLCRVLGPLIAVPAHARIHLMRHNVKSGRSFARFQNSWQCACHIWVRPPRPTAGWLWHAFRVPQLQVMLRYSNSVCNANGWLTRRLAACLPGWQSGSFVLCATCHWFMKSRLASETGASGVKDLPVSVSVGHQRYQWRGNSISGTELCAMQFVAADYVSAQNCSRNEKEKKFVRCWA